MNHPFAVLPDLPLQPQSTFGSTTRPLTLVRLDSPATAVMTDFASVSPVTVTLQTPIDVALRKMKTSGVRLLFVVNDIDEIIGLITATDIMGERPIKFTQQTRIARAGIPVAAIMTPQFDIQVLDAARVEAALVGDIVTTLHALQRQHALVAKIDAGTQTHRVIGMFSTSQISRLLGDDLAQEPPPAHSLAEIVEKIG
jgi:CBS-domain-containing membrane protein